MKRIKPWLTGAAALLLVAAGLVLLLTPWLRDTARDREQQRLLDEWNTAMQVLAVNAAEEDVPPASGSAADTPDTQAWDSAQQETAAVTQSASSAQPTAGVVLRIDKIDLRLPVLRGATETNLNRSLSSIDANGVPGAEGNYTVAGHRSHRYGRMFNRLGELQAGDRIEVESADGSFAYIVDEVLVVKPDETWVLDAQEGERRLTLVTCDPMINPTHRLIVRCVMA